jgi:hypothetical protein
MDKSKERIADMESHMRYHWVHCVSADTAIAIAQDRPYQPPRLTSRLSGPRGT